jgi:hypothetical protein
MMKTITSEKELINFLRGLREQAEEVPSAAPAPAPAPAPAGAIPPAQGNAPGAQQPITVDDIIDKLNIVRAGRSTKDADVKRELDEYIAQFNEDEKMALVAFLQGLGQILTSGVDSADAADPADPYALQIKKSLGASTANAVRGATPAVSASPAPAAPAGPVPIKVGGA